MHQVFEYERFSEQENDVLHKSSTDIPLFMQNQDQHDDPLYYEQNDDEDPDGQ